MANILRFVLGNFTLSFLVLGFVASAIYIMRAPKPVTAPVVAEGLLSYFVLFSTGFSYLYNFVLHTFLGEMTARFIGWANSPFQLEVGFASLGFAVIGFLAFRRSFDLRLAAVLGPAMFLLGAAGGHIYQIVEYNNYAPGNAGVILYTDVLLPIIGFALLWFDRWSKNSLNAARRYDVQSE